LSTDKFLVKEFYEDPISSFAWSC